MTLYFARQYDDAVEQLKKVIDMEPNFGQAYHWLAFSYSKKGLFEDAIAARKKDHELSGSKGPIVQSPAMAVYMAKSGKREEALKILSSSAFAEFSPWAHATVYGALGENDEAFRLLDQAYEERSPSLAVAKVDPRLDPLRDDPRFQDLLRRMNFPE
jgi:tetratricopeptide (TPR) repeat protein